MAADNTKEHVLDKVKARLNPDRKRWLTFYEYLSSKAECLRDESEAAIYEAIAKSPSDISYREASLLFADDPLLSYKFEYLWYRFEDCLDYQNYVRDHKEPEHISTIIGRIMARLRVRGE